MEWVTWGWALTVEVVRWRVRVIRRRRRARWEGGGSCVMGGPTINRGREGYVRGGWEEIRGGCGRYLNEERGVEAGEDHFYVLGL